MKRIRLCVAFAIWCFFSQGALAEASVDALEKEGIKRIDSGNKAQQQISEIHEKTRSMADDYQEHLKLVEGLQVYNEMLREQLANQRREIGLLEGSITEVAKMERQILPLLARMTDGLEQFVSLDVPFLKTERIRRVEQLRSLLSRSDVTVAEKARRVMEAYQIENEYGRTIEAYKDKLTLGDASFDADFLRIGRVALVYKTVGNEEVGYWDTVAASWKPLPGVPYRRYVKEGLKVAKQEVAPELISIPINPMQQVK